MIRKSKWPSFLVAIAFLMVNPWGANAEELVEAFRAHFRGDDKAAVRILEQHADKRPEAAFLLASIYMDGSQGVTANPREAVRLLAHHAQRGHAPSQYGLGLAYVGGRGVPQDFIQAHLWFNLAAASGDEMMRKGGAERREQIARAMTAVQVGEAQRLAREWQATTN
jgi:TPR repeat protein